MRLFVLLLIAWSAASKSFDVANEIKELAETDANEEEINERLSKWIKKRAFKTDDSCTVVVTGPGKEEEETKNPMISYLIECGGKPLKKGEKKLRFLKPMRTDEGIHLFTKMKDGSMTYVLVESGKSDFEKIELKNLPAFGKKFAAPMVVTGGEFTIKDCSFENNGYGLQAGAILFTGSSDVDIKKGDFFANRGEVGAIRVKDSVTLNMEDVTLERNKGVIVGGTLIEGGANFIGEYCYYVDNIAETDEERNIQAHAGDIMMAGDSNGFFNKFMFVGQGMTEDQSLSLLDETVHEDDIIHPKSPDASGLKMEDKATLILIKSNFNNCTSRYGALMTTGSSVLTLKSTNFTNNAAIKGGALYVEGTRGSYAKTRTAKFEGNMARYGGAMVVAGNGTFAIDACSFFGNEAVNGGAIWGDYANTDAGTCEKAAQGSRVDIQTSKFVSNNAFKSGGAFYIKCTDIQSNQSTFEKNEASGNGGVMYAEDTYDLNFIDCTFDGNKAGENGGSLYVKKSHDVLSERCTYVNGIAGKSGGAISSVIGHGVHVRDCSIVDNVAGKNDGGAIHAQGLDNIDIANSDLTRNKAGQSGGALSLHDSNHLRVSNVNVTGNVASGNGGAIQMSNGQDAWIMNMNISGIAAESGAISMRHMGAVHVTDIHFIDNHATKQCGALEIDGATSAVLTELLFHSNSAANFGGSLCLSNAANAVINDTEFTYNTALEGGAVYMDGGGDINIADVIFENNYGRIGGAIRGNGLSNLVLENSTFDTNRAKLRGSAVHLDRSSLDVQKSRFTNGFVGAKAVAPVPEEARETKASSEKPSADDNAVSSTSGGTISMMDGDSFKSSDNLYFKNRADHIGGMLLMEDMKSVFIQYDNFIKGVSKLSGGCVYGMHVQNMSVWDSRFEQCHADNGGALLLEGASVAEGGYNRFINNTAVSGGAFLCKGSSKVNMQATNFSYNAAAEGSTVSVSCICNIDFQTSAFYREKERKSNGDFFHVSKGCGNVNANGCQFYGKMDKRNRLTTLHWIGIFSCVIVFFIIIFAVFRRRLRRTKEIDSESQQPLIGHRIEIEVSEEDSSEYETDETESSYDERRHGKQATSSKQQKRRETSSEDDSLLETEEDDTEDDDSPPEKKHKDGVKGDEEEQDDALPPIGPRSAKESRAAARRRHASTVSINDGAGPSYEVEEEEVLPPELPPKLSLSLSMSMDRESTMASETSEKIPEALPKEELSKAETIPEERGPTESDDDVNTSEVTSPFKK